MNYAIKKDEEDTTTSAESIDSDFEKKYDKNRKVLFNGKLDLTDSEHWLLVYITDGKLSLDLAKKLVKKVDISSVSSKAMLSAIDTAMAKLASGEIKHPVNWMAAVIDNAQLATGGRTDATSI